MAVAIWSYSFLDGHGVPVPARYYFSVPEAATLAQLHTEWETFGTILQTISSAKLVGGQSQLKYGQKAGWLNVPDPASDHNVSGLFDFIQANSIYREGYIVPALAEAAMDTGGGPDLTNDAVKDYIDAVVSGRGLTAQYTGISKPGNDITGLFQCRISGRSNRKALIRNTTRSGSGYVPGA